MGRKYYEVWTAASMGEGTAGVETPAEDTLSAEEVFHLLIKPVCTMCAFCPTDARAALFGNLGPCGEDKRTQFTESLKVDLCDESGEEEWHKRTPTGLEFKRLTVKCKSFKLRR